MHWRTRHTITRAEQTVRLRRAWPRFWQRRPIRTITLTKATGNFAPGTRVEIRFNDPGPHASICPPEHEHPDA